MATFKINAADHPIKSVTIFKSPKAEVVRVFTLNLKDGSNRVEIKGLPSVIDTHSVRVSGLGEARLFDVVCTISDDTQDETSPSEAVRVLQVKKYALESERRVREHESELLVGYAKTLTGEHVKPGQMAEFLASFVEQGRVNLEAITSLGEKIVQIDRQIAAEQRKLALKQGSLLGEATVIIGSEVDVAVGLKLTYIVSEASWESTYELHAKTANGKPSPSVFVHYCARITQSTGEDWTGTALTLNTVASDTMAKSIPKLGLLKLKQRPVGFVRGGFFSNNNRAFPNTGPGQATLFGIPQQQQQQQQQQMQQMQQAQLQDGTTASPFGAVQTGSAFSASNLFGSASSGLPPPSQQPAFGSSLFGSTALTVAAEALVPEGENFEEIDVPGPFAEPMTVVSESPLSIAYAVEGKCTIPSDGVSHKVSIAILPFEAKVTYVSVPRVEPEVYLQCEVKNTSEYRLLPGPVSVILDGSYVSKTSIQDINTGDTFDCTLGVDPSTKVTYSRTLKTIKDTTGPFVESSNTTTCRATITVHNKHQFAIPELIVRDVVPMCDDKRVKVILREPAGLAGSKAGEVIDLKRGGQKVKWDQITDGKGGEKEGKFVWIVKVEAGEKAKMDASWEVKTPYDVNWVEAFE